MSQERGLIRKEDRWIANPARLVAAALIVAGLCAAGCGGFGRSSRIAGISLISELEGSFQTVIRQEMPSVVSLRVERHSTTPVAAYDERGRRSELMVQESVVVNGSGMVLREDGLLLTNEHVVHKAEKITVTFADGDSQTAEVVASDTRGDLAVLRTRRSGLRPVRFGDARQLARGQWSIAIGNPLGIARDGQLSASVGVISNVRRDLPGLGEEDDRRYTDMVQTTAPISPGNSGGPLFNLRGEVIGVVTAMYARGGGEDGLAFAIPATQRFQENVARLAQGGSVTYGYVGVTVRTLEASEARAVGAGEAGVLVLGLDEQGPAAKAGLEVGDVIVQLNEEPIVTAADFVDRVGLTAVGSVAQLGVVRGGSVTDLPVHVARREGRQVAMLR